MYKHIKRLGFLVTISCITIILAGCAAVQTEVSKHNLDVQTKESASVFLDPVPDSQKVVYVQMKNTSDKQNFNVQDQVVSALRAKDYKVTHSLNKAHYLLQANILKVGKTSPSAAEKALGGGFGSAISGAAFGTAVGAFGDTNSMLAGGLIGAAVGTVADAAVKDVTYAVVTDVQISERVKGAIYQRSRSKLKQGTSSVTVQTSSDRTHWKRYRTRILSTAEKVNLSFNEAEPKLKAGLTQAISGIF